MPFILHFNIFNTIIIINLISIRKVMETKVAITYVKSLRSFCNFITKECNKFKSYNYFNKMLD